MQDNYKITFVGCGNLATSIVQGLIQDGYPRALLSATTRSTERVNYLREELQIQASSNNIEAVSTADVVVLAVKPQQMRAVVEEIAPIIQERRPLIISVAIGVSVELLERWAQIDSAIIRSMPNTPALIGAGASGLFANKHVTKEQRDIAESIHRAVGMTVWVKDESLINAVASVSGSGPAYIFYVIEAMQKAGEKLGLSAETSKLLALQTAVGASRLALESADDVETLRKNVTSPNGTTEQAIKVFDESELSAIFEQAMLAASQRAEVLTELLGQSE